MTGPCGGIMGKVWQNSGMHQKIPHAVWCYIYIEVLFTLYKESNRSWNAKGARDERNTTALLYYTLQKRSLYGLEYNSTTWNSVQPGYVLHIMCQEQWFVITKGREMNFTPYKIIQYILFVSCGAVYLPTVENKKSPVPFYLQINNPLYKRYGCV
jgi:hypothetical protein